MERNRDKEYVVSLSNDVEKYIEENRKILSSDDYVAAIECYKNAAQMIEKGVRVGKGRAFDRDARRMLLRLSEEGKKYLERAEELKKKGRNPVSRLLKKMGFIIISLLFISSFILLQSNFTGFVVLGSSVSVSNGVGIGLFGLGFLGVFLYLR